MQSIIRSFALALALLFSCAAAQAETNSCVVIGSVPYTVTQPGIYCLKKPLATSMASGAAITISADDVRIDMNGYLLDGSGAGPATLTTGIAATARKNVHLMNGTIRGFRLGVSLNGNTSQGHRVEDLLLDRNVAAGLTVIGQGSIVRRNLVVATGSVTATFGIFASGAGVHVTDNRVVDTVEAAGGTAVGIYVIGGTGAAVERNHVSNGAFGPTASKGIYVIKSPNITLVNNRIANMRDGIYYQVSTGLYMDNTVSGATTPVTNGTAAGATNFDL